MEEKVIKLINILDAKFEIPTKTGGMNIVRSQAQILAVINNYWPMDGNYTIEDFEVALLEFNAPNIINWLGERNYLLIEK